jgi:hypothetical protein
MMTKWDTIQADVADAYIHLDEIQEEESDSLYFEDLENVTLDDLFGELA